MHLKKRNFIEQLYYGNLRDNYRWDDMVQRGADGLAVKD